FFRYFFFFLLSLLRSVFFFSSTLLSPSSPLFPYTTLFRSLFLHRDTQGTHLAIHVAAFQAQRLCCAADVAVVFIQLFENVITLIDRKSTRLNSSHLGISYAVFCLKKKKKKK